MLHHHLPFNIVRSWNGHCITLYRGPYALRLNYFSNGFELPEDGRWIFLIPAADIEESVVINNSQMVYYQDGCVNE
jgi:hypothetical protein